MTVTLDAESFTFPRHLIERCSSALLLFCSGRMGASDGHWIAEQGLTDVTCVDWDAATLEPFADEYPATWHYVEADVFEWMERDRGRRWDIVSADAPSQLADRLVEMLPRYCALARRYVTATHATVGVDSEADPPAAPQGWRYMSEPTWRIYANGRMFWWLMLEREPIVAFDDGPCETTGPILDILAEHQARAVFFVNGKNIAGNEHLLERMVAEGHEIGNHGWSHRALVDDGITLPEVLTEIQSTHDAIVAAAGVSPTKFRTPFVRWSV